MSETVTLPKDVAQRVFDALVSSMDFGSGFLDTEDVKALRALAMAIGVNPIKGTPEEFVTQYPHEFVGPDDRGMIAEMFDAGERKGHWDGVWPTATWVDETVIDESRMPAFTPCRAGTYSRWCRKPADDPIHSAREARPAREETA